MALPNSVHSSDHIPLMAEFAYYDDLKSYQKEHSQSNSPSAHSSKRNAEEKSKIKSKTSSSQSTSNAVVMNKTKDLQPGSAHQPNPSHSHNHGHHRPMYPMTSLSSLPTDSYPFLEDTNLTTNNASANRNGMTSSTNMMTTPHLLTSSHSQQPSTIATHPATMYANATPNITFPGAEYTNYPAYDHYDRMTQQYNSSGRYGYYEY